MRILIVGNTGSGKSTMAKRLRAEHALEHLDLDTVFFRPGSPEPRPDAEIRGDLERFVASTDRWVIEGSHGAWIEWLCDHATELRWLDPGEQRCLENHARRPYESHKHSSPEAQAQMLATLEAWLRDYETRHDQFGAAWHRRLYEAFEGTKQIYRSEDLPHV